MTETLQVSLRIFVLWNDSRLTFKNLLDEGKVNYLGQHLSTLWIPLLVIQNEENLAGTAKANKQLYVMRKGLPVRTGQDYIYTGSENSVLLIQKQSYYISCKFNMRAFPFDVQDCWINITIGNSASDSMRLSANLYHVIRDLKMNEYDVLDCNLTVSKSTMHVWVRLRRFPEYHILSSYFPVFLLHLLGYGTLFIDPHDFQDRGTMSLTSLLVLISFYSDSAMALPKTSYLKMIDFWYIFSITFLSLIIGVHLVTNRVKRWENPPDKSTMVQMFHPLSTAENYGDDIGPKGSSSSHNVNVSRNFNASVLFGAKIIFGVIYIIFHVVYWSSIGLRN
ncbi:ligand-gated ion channel 50-like [Palaemon carinicauda]|uniref:ligand-gated ion channel 50-like n=1 Tax=Palaemon carinicauda TaxID=392227 RepID=UPI0035B6518D